MVKKTLLAAALLFSAFAFSQNYVHQVLILNEGYYDFSASQQVIPVSVASYDPSSQTYTSVATINNVRFGSSIVSTDNAFYVAADTLLLKYDKDNYQLLDQETIIGIRKIAEHNGQLVITRGELGGLPHYVEVRSAADLSFQYAITPADGLSWSCEGIHIENDIAYLAINNAFDWGNLVGKVGRLDLNSGTYLGAIDLGANGINPERVMYKNGKILTVNNKDFSGSSISTVDELSANLDQTADISASSGCGASVLADDFVYFQEYALGKVSRFDPQTSSILDTLVATDSYYGMENSPIEQVIYATKTDFVSTGEIIVLDYNGNVITTVTAGVSAGNLAIDERMSTSVAQLELEELEIRIQDEQVYLPYQAAYSIFDLRGQLVLSGQANGSAGVSLSNLATGTYTVVQKGASARFFK